MLLGAVTSSTDAAAVFSVLRARAAAAPADRRARGRVRTQRRADRRPGRRSSRAAPRSSTAVGYCGLIAFELLAGARDRTRGRVRRRLGDAPRRAAVLRALPARPCWCSPSGVRRRGRCCTPPASPPCTSPRWCSATRTCRTGGDPVVRRGGGVAGADRPVRDARPAAVSRAGSPAHVGLALAAGLVLTLVAGPLSVLAVARS